MACFILGQFEKLPPGDRTHQAETGLGIKSSLYWYILRAEEQFGYAVFLWRASMDQWSRDDGGACPFDSGGLWHGLIHTAPALRNEEERKTLFAKYDLGLPDWSTGFRQYLSDNYSETGDYIQGATPRTGVPEILKSAPNSAQAWTWEARVGRDTFRPDRVQLTTLYWHQAQADSFLNWVEMASPYDDPVQEDLTEWILDHHVVCPISTSPARQATADLIEISKA